jgi:hypothetical protein
MVTICSFYRNLIFISLDRIARCRYDAREIDFLKSWRTPLFPAGVLAREKLPEKI